MTISTTPARATPSAQLTGTAFVLAATVAWSFSGTFSRLLATDVTTAIAWRSFFGGVFLAIPFFFQCRGQALRAMLTMGRPGLAMTAAGWLCQASTVGAFYKTSIANVAVIYATAPFMAAGLAYGLIGERMRPRTMIASAIALLGVMIIVWNGFGTGHLVGDLMAVVMTLSFAVIVVIPRACPDAAMMPPTILSAALIVLIFGPFGHPTAMPGHDWLVLAAFGLTNFTVALYLFLAGSRRIAAAQAALIGTLEVVLSPLWAWLVFGERPSLASVIGGGMILAVVIWHTRLDLRSERTSDLLARSP